MLPDKLYFRIGEVSDIVGVKPYVLRYWETEFSDVKPTKSKSGQRLYKKRDVELLLKVKDLLYIERFTINGAKQRLRELGKLPPATEKHEARVPSPTYVEIFHDEEPESEELFSADDEETIEDAPAKVEVKSNPAPVANTQSASQSVDRKFLEKVKADLKWCLDELRS